MAAIQWTDVTDQAPELGTASAGAQFALLAYANTQIAVSGLAGGEDGIAAKLARVYWCAHTATLLRRRGQAGTKTSQSSGPVSESFSPIAMSRIGEFAQTTYGILYGTILNSSAHRAGRLNNKIVVMPGVNAGGYGYGYWGGSRGGGYGY